MKRIGWLIFWIAVVCLLSGIGYLAGRNWSPNDGLGNLGGTFWSTLIGAVVGALAAGAISFVLQEVAAKRTLEADRLREQDRRLTSAQTAMARVVRIHSGLGMIYSHISDSLSEANDRGEWFKSKVTIVRPLANHFPIVEFTAEEQALVRKLGDNELTNMFLELDAIYNDSAALISRYSRDRSNLFNEFGGEVTDGVAITKLSDTDRPRFLTRVSEIDDLITHLIGRIRDDVEQAAETIARLEAAGRRAFGNEFGHYVSKNPDRFPIPHIDVKPKVVRPSVIDRMTHVAARLASYARRLTFRAKLLFRRIGLEKPTVT